MLGSPERSPTPSPGRRHSFKGILRVELADAARQLGCQRQLQTIACLSFLAGAVWAVTLVGLGAAPLAHFQRHGGKNACSAKGGGWCIGRRQATASFTPSGQPCELCSAFIEGRAAHRAHAAPLLAVAGRRALTESRSEGLLVSVRWPEPLLFPPDLGAPVLDPTAAPHPLLWGFAALRGCPYASAGGATRHRAPRPAP